MTTQRISLIFGALIMCVVTVATAMMMHNRAVDDATALVMYVNSRALGTWNPESVVDNSDSTLRDGVADDFFHTYFRTLSRLGSLQSINDIRFDVALGPVWQLYRTGSASYTMNAVFDNGQAEVRITLSREQGQWRIREYLVLTPMLAA